MQHGLCFKFMMGCEKFSWVTFFHRQHAINDWLFCIELPISASFRARQSRNLFTLSSTSFRWQPIWTCHIPIQSHPIGKTKVSGHFKYMKETENLLEQVQWAITLPISHTLQIQWVSTYTSFFFILYSISLPLYKVGPNFHYHTFSISKNVITHPLNYGLRGQISL